MPLVQLRLVRDGITGRLRAQVAGLGGGQRTQILRAAGQEFKAITTGAIGANGQNRPQGWSPLSPEYAKRIGRQDATLFLTQAERQKAGKKGGPHLSQKVLVPSVNSKQVTIAAQVPYASAHQLGSKKRNIPARPYFPVTQNKRVTNYANNRIMRIIKDKLRQFGVI